MQSTSENKLTDYEAALYDRGIRLWGVDAQIKLRQSKVLFIGINGLMSEIIKNVVLAGVDSIALIDNHIVTYSDLSAHLFLTTSSVGKKRSDESVASIVELNPLVNVQVLDKDINDIDSELVKEYTVICMSDHSFNSTVKINNLARLNQKYFISTMSFGMNGYFFSDLGAEFTYILKNTDDKQPDQVHFKEISSHFQPLNQVLQFKWSNFHATRTPTLLFILSILYQHESSHLKLVDKSTDIDQLLNSIPNSEKYRDFLKLIIKNLNSELAPVCAIVGGIVGSEIIKIISKNNDVINNFFFYDGTKGLVETVTNDI
ncbi:sumo-activating enzyme subunit 1 [Tieghemostelium lacteum]|uniref:Ubiquitin-like 1-activating enzyme E1A n=1 Tax=Tieghemostelium lacteum TaxID=361077 RepID=A0A151Z440_TIELA|nr:sumo-activating enzyme subunit 1 [Tieghemostelium lacteum]|eukprot:KYQ88711.1 sumo-activating enzyme subunit 1 [Tieghemostelium lacteum]